MGLEVGLSLSPLLFKQNRLFYATFSDIGKLTEDTQKYVILVASGNFESDSFWKRNWVLLIQMDLESSLYPKDDQSI